MTAIGEIIQSEKLGIKAKSKYIFAPCSICGKPRWVLYIVKKQKPIRDRCLSCAIKAVHERNRKNIIPKGTPFIGEIRRGREIGSGDKKHPYIFSKCPVCGIERWVTFRGEKSNPTQRCQRCSAKASTGENHPNWKGGRIRHSLGYINIKVLPNDFFYPMADASGYVSEHRLVIAKHLKRCLLPWEIVHHKNGIKDDNNMNNLQLLPSKKYHIADTLTKSHLKTMKSRIDYLEAMLQAYNIPFKGYHNLYEGHPERRPNK